MSCKGIRESLLPSVDSILGIRDQIGATIKTVYVVTRTWYNEPQFTTPATQIGEGYAVDNESQLYPTPRIKDLSQDIRLREGGTVKQGDIILMGVSRNSFAEMDLDGSSPSGNVEKLYRVGDKLYQVINVVENLLTWNVQLRELTNQTRY